MTLSPDQIERLWADLRACVDAEARIWSLREHEEILRVLKDGPHCYQVVRNGISYEFVAVLLDRADAQFVTVILEAQAADQTIIHQMAHPRRSGGWTDLEMGLISESITVPRGPN